MIDLLGRHLADLAESDRAALARLAEGSIGRALDLAAAGGLTLYRDLMALLGTLPRLDLVAAHGLGDKLARKGGDTAYYAVTDLLVWWLARFARSLAQGLLPPEMVPAKQP